MNDLFRFFPYAAAIWVLACGLWGVMTSRNLVHLVICLSVVESASYVLLLAVGWRDNGAAPYFVSPPGGQPVDPIVQALMLTDVVIEATVFALLLALVLKIHERAGTLDPIKLRTERG
jgi:multicomponent Na+:H+ antiporter subunit C